MKRPRKRILRGRFSCQRRELINPYFFPVVLLAGVEDGVGVVEGVLLFLVPVEGVVLGVLLGAGAGVEDCSLTFSSTFLWIAPARLLDVAEEPVKFPFIVASRAVFAASVVFPALAC